MVSEELVIKFARAIAHAEGFGLPGKIPTRCHNPGDLAEGDMGNGTARSVGIGAADITIFATDSDGWAALYRQVRKILSGASRYYTLDMSLLKLGSVYAESPVAWGTNFAEHFGVETTTTLVDIVSADLAAQNAAGGESVNG